MSHVQGILTNPRRWFSIDGPVHRGDYLVLGLTLGVLKYAIEATVVAIMTGQLFTPLDYVNPWLNFKAPFLMDSPGAATQVFTGLVSVWSLKEYGFTLVSTAMLYAEVIAGSPSAFSVP